MAKQQTLPGVQLAKGVEYKGKFPPKAKFVYLEVKKDGIRGCIIDGKAYTRTGVRVVNAPLVEKAMAAIPQTAKNFVLDGEYFYEDCQKTLGIVKTQTPDHADRLKLQFFVFDIIAKKEWDAKKCETPLKRRKVNLEVALTKIKLSKKLKPKTKQSIQKFVYVTVKPEDKHVQAFHKKACKAGHEGTMMKNPLSVYSFRKNSDWQKLKPIRESDLKVVGVKEGNGKHKGKLGSVQIKGVVDKEKICTWCGGGFKDNEREALWKLHKKGELIGKIIEMKHEGITKKKALRFPGFRRIHPDKNPW